MPVGGKRPGAGRPPGSKGGKRNRAKLLASKILYEKIDGKQTRIERLFRELLDAKAGNARERETALRALTKLMEYADGKPADKVQHSGSIKGGNVVVLPDKKAETDWMKEHGQEEVVELSPEKPN